tara:strand:+ start:197 stop:508 length:312 start_codon:yes stop_codon:yes gene_type:complete
MLAAEQALVNLRAAMLATATPLIEGLRVESSGTSGTERSSGEALEARDVLKSEMSECCGDKDGRGCTASPFASASPFTSESPFTSASPFGSRGMSAASIVREF